MKQSFAVLKVSEGGIGQKEAIRQLKEAKIQAQADYSPYVGHSGVLVTGTPEQVEQANEILFGKE